MRYNLKNNTEVAHVWANQLQETGRGSNLFFESDGTIYSYGRHFAIAKHVVNKKGEKAILFTIRSYSISTAKHISLVRNAIPYGTKIIHVYNPNSTNEDMFNSWLDSIKNVSYNLQIARKPERFLLAIKRYNNEINDYANFFGYKIPALLKKAMAIVDTDTAKAFAKNVEKYEKQEIARRQKAASKQVEKQLQKWRMFETNYVSTRIDRDYLRYNSDKNRVETSQGIEIPVLVAKAFYEYLVERREQNNFCRTEAECNKLFFGRYTVREIQPDYIIVGCHKIYFDEINRIANLLQW